MDAPAADTIEVVVFGRTVGEAILIHVGDGIWASIDCLQTSRGECAPLDYLRAIGVDVSTALHFVVATHWHDDHVRGLSALYAEAKSAELCFSSALRQDEFIAFLDANLGEDMGPVTSGVRELFDCFRLGTEKGRPPPLVLNSSQYVFQYPAGRLSHGFPVSMHTLSPSPHDVLEFFTSLRAVGRPGPVASTIVDPKQNEVSVATWLTAGPAVALFGADLENFSSPLRGWKQVLASPRQPSGAANLFKVPHHGSTGAYHADVITRYLTSDALSVLTPFSKSSLPRDGDVRRVVGHSREAYIAQATGRRKFKAKDPSLDTLMRTAGIGVSSFPSEVGFVRFRWKLPVSTQWSSDTFMGAKKLSTIRRMTV